MLETRVRAKSWESRRKRGRVLLEEAGEILRDFVLFAKQIRRILVKHFALPIRQRTFMLTTTSTLAASPVVEL